MKKTFAHASDKAEILRRLRRVRPDSARRWGRMSAHQMMCHATDAFRMALGQKPVTPATSIVQRTIVKWIALYAPLQWPSGIRTRPEVDQEGGGTRPIQFDADVAELERIIEVLASTESGFAPAHPMFGRMSPPDWLRWAYLHVDHHLRQFGV